MTRWKRTQTRTGTASILASSTEDRYVDVVSLNKEREISKILVANKAGNQNQSKSRYHWYILNVVSVQLGYTAHTTSGLRR